MSEEPTQSMGGSDPERTRSTAPAAGTPLPAVAHAVPARIGRYTIVRVLGEGGLGTVYEAEQDQPKRAVALKVIRAGYLSPQLLKRFEHESAVLGRLQHPGIAQVYEAGTVQDERGHPVPFFAMEFIRGVPLTDYASQKNLGTRERLDLVARICDAVYHAHQKGVIHRDLKPGNILVDESGQPKILDFGVARATDSDIQQTTLQTDIGQLIGTVPYMSPEQVSGDPDDLDTRSDVYALGVIAYELLAGRLPYDLSKRLIHEAVRVIREEEPTRLSSIDRTLRGDVETIVAKALEKDKARRYQSAESLASDIRRYLKDEPIAARPASTWYQATMFARRNRGLVVGVGGAFVILIVASIALWISRQVAVGASKRADAARNQAWMIVGQSEVARATDLISTFAVSRLKTYKQAHAFDPWAAFCWDWRFLEPSRFQFADTDKDDLFGRIARGVPAVGRGPHWGVATSPAANMVLWTRLSPSGTEDRETCTLQTEGVAQSGSLSANANWLALWTPTGSVAVFTFGSSTPSHTRNPDGTAFRIGLAVADDGRQVLETNENRASIVNVPLNTRIPIGPTTADENGETAFTSARYASFSADGDLVAVWYLSNALRVFRTDDGTEVAVRQAPKSHESDGLGAFAWVGDSHTLVRV